MPFPALCNLGHTVPWNSCKGKRLALPGGLSPSFGTLSCLSSYLERDFHYLLVDCHPVWPANYRGRVVGLSGEK